MATRRILLTVAALATVLGCTLTPATVATIEAVDAAACAALTAIPVIGEVAALACPGEEALLAAALAADVAAHPPASALPASATVAASTPRAIITRRTKHGKRMIGVVRADRAARCQTIIDAHPITDAQHPEVSTWSIDGGVTPSVESLDGGKDGAL